MKVISILLGVSALALGIVTGYLYGVVEAAPRSVQVKNPVVMELDALPRPVTAKSLQDTDNPQKALGW